jgi:hypothetical protein
MTDIRAQHESETLSSDPTACHSKSLIKPIAAAETPDTPTWVARLLDVARFGFVVLNTATVRQPNSQAS